MYCTKQRIIILYDRVPNMSESESIVRNLFTQAGITINGTMPWDIQIHDKRCYDRFLKERSFGFGEAYIDGWWDTYALDETIAKIVQAKLEDELLINKTLALSLLKKRLLHAAENSNRSPLTYRHYDLGNELFEAMLDPDLNYSCGYWKNLGNPETSWRIPRNLIKAQQAKLQLICKKLLLKRGVRILDIGCSWGSFATYASSEYGAQVISITPSRQQAIIAKKRSKGLPVKIFIQDFKDLQEQKQYDRIVSIDMLEHVSPQNYILYFNKMAFALKKDGFFLLQTIGSHRTSATNNPWIEKYIFPNSHIPSLTQITKAVENRFVIEEVENFGPYYYPTLMSWFRNFNKNWKKLAVLNSEKYNDRFYRMWKFYLLSSAGFFKAGELQFWQIVLSKRNNLRIYKAF